MKLSSVVLYPSDTSEGIELSIQEDDMVNRYIVRQLVGVDAEEIVPKFHGSGLVTGNRFYEATMKARQLVARIALNPHYHVNESVAEIRNELYKLISPNRPGLITIHFKSGGVVISTIKGRIVKFETAYFNKIPELQVTFKCDDPIFRSHVPVDFDVVDLPSSGPVSIPDTYSTAPHGFELRVKFTATTSTFVIQDDPTTPDWKFEVTPASSFVVDDELCVCSEYQRKEVYVDLDAGGTVHLMDKVLSGSIWPMLYPGNNVLHFPQIANFDWMELKYLSAYWGV